MAYYSEYPGQVSGSPNNTEYLQEQVNRISQDLHQYARQQGIVLEDGPVCYDSYYQGHPYVVPPCQICGIHGHTPADCQRGNPYRPDCFGMSFARSCQSNYSYGRPEYPNLTYGNNNPQFSSFPSSAPLQDFGYAENNNFCAAQTQYFAHSDVPQHQELFQEEEPSALDKAYEKLKLLLGKYSDTGSPKDSLQLTSERLDEALQSVADSEVELNTVETSQSPQVPMFATSDHLELKPEGVDCPDCRDDDQFDDVVDNNTEDADARVENEESEIRVDVSLVMQESADAGLSIPLNHDMFLTDISTLVSHSMIPLLKVELNHHLLKTDNPYSVIDIANARNQVSHNSSAIIILENACAGDAHLYHNENCYPNYDTLLADSYHATHVLYSYTYMIGYSIDDLLGVNPITSASCSLCEFIFRFLLVDRSLELNMVRIDIPWDPGGFKAW